MNLYQQIYDKLHSEFGEQRWWPVTIDGHTPGYHCGPKNEKHQLEVIFGAILTQNTNWMNVEKAIINLNKNNLINIDRILKIKHSRLAQLIRPSGYFRQKAHRLKIISKHIKSRYEGRISKFFDKDVPDLRQELLSIEGIGPETADSIILYAAKKPIFVIDAYTKRIFSRVGVCKEDCRYEDLQKVFHSNVDKDHKLYNEYHALLVELAKRNCRKMPICDSCPIKNRCNYFKTKFLKDRK